MTNHESLESSTSGKTELSKKESIFLNRNSEPGSRLRNMQLKVIDGLRKKYPPGSPAQHALDIFDPRTGLAVKMADLADQAFHAYYNGDTEKANNLINQLKDLKPQNP